MALTAPAGVGDEGAKRSNLITLCLDWYSTRSCQDCKYLAIRCEVNVAWWVVAKMLEVIATFNNLNAPTQEAPRPSEL